MSEIQEASELEEDLTTEEVTTEEIETDSEILGSTPPISLARNKHGLIRDKGYKFNQDGSVDWFSLCEDDDIVLNRDVFLRKTPSIDITKCSEEEISLLKKEASDKEKLITLPGLRRLAWLRGYKSIEHKVIECSTSRAVVQCRIEWIPNYEFPDGAVQFDVANSTTDNTFDFAALHLEAIAANRAFSRAVRSFLRLPVAGQDELKVESSVSEVSVGIEPSSPHGALLKLLTKKGYTFDQLKKTVEVKYPEEFETVLAWGSITDIPIRDVSILLTRLSKITIDS